MQILMSASIKHITVTTMQYVTIHLATTAAYAMMDIREKAIWGAVLVRML